MSIKKLSNLTIILMKLLIICLFITNVSFVNCHNKFIDRYRHPEIQHYKPMLFNVQRLELLVGARDYIVILNLEDFNSVPKLQHYMPPTNEKKNKCHIKGLKSEECHNFITTLLPIANNGQVLVCGTNAYSPECQIHSLSKSLDYLNKSLSINAYCPFWNTTSLITSTGAFFYGGPLDLRGIDSSIIKQRNIYPNITPSYYSDKRIVRSAQHDSKWINADANFIFSFEYGEHVYFLFRETAVEYLNIGKRVYSRVGRVCKEDPGWRENWTTFLKARINCSLPGSFPFYFDEIQSVSYVDNGGTPTLYAIFNTPQNSIHGSAVCAFTMDSVLEAFRGPFKYQKSSNNIWERVNDDHNVFECKVTNNSEYHQSYSNSMRLNNIYQQVDDAVQPIDSHPFIVSKNERFQFIAVDITPSKYYNAVEVMFIATTDGKLLKYVKWPGMAESCLVDEVQLIDPSENRFLSMKFFADTRSLYFGTEKEVIRISVHQCHNYRTETQCIQSGDPYCGWSQTKMKCVEPPGKNFRDENWIQSNQTTCLPRWSKWFTCNGANRVYDETCKCRKRPCERCYDGFEFEVANCTRDGGWSEWSSWSSCSPSCSRGKQYRTRVCNNPSPSNVGKQCSGKDREERQCDHLPSCRWSEWSEWTNCSMDCTGLSKRTRQCFDLDGNPVDKEFCQGDFINTIKCECKKTFEWTDWSITDLNMNEVVEQRTEIVMHKNNIMPRNEQRVVSLKYCDHCGGYVYNFKKKDFLIKECNCSEESIWSDWSSWSQCYNAIQERQRNCLRADGQCDGHFKEVRYCHHNNHHHHLVRADITAHHRAAPSNAKPYIIAVLLAVVSSALTAMLFLCCFYRQSRASKPIQNMMNTTISCEPNTYEEPEKYRLDSSLASLPVMNSSTLTRVSSLKQNPSFRAKLDDSNY